MAVAQAKLAAWTITGSATPVEERTGAAVTRAKVVGRITGSVTPVEEIVAAAVGAMGAGIARLARAAVDALPVR